MRSPQKLPDAPPKPWSYSEYANVVVDPEGHNRILRKLPSTQPGSSRAEDCGPLDVGGH